jgi:hypothetical protein
VSCATMKYLNIVVALLPSLSIAKLGETNHDRRQQANPPLVQVGLNPSFKLGRCQGDCNADSDCNSSDLFCFGRTEAFVAVPGCSGGLNDASLFDYCVRKSDLNPPLVQVGLNPSFKLERCQGDCDADSDCNSSDLVCFGRTEAFVDVPGCSGGLDDASLFDYCVRKSDLPDPTPDPSPDPTPGPSPDPTPDPSPTPVPPVAGDVPLKYSKDFPLALCEGTSNGVRNDA